MTQPVLSVRHEDSSPIPPIMSFCPDYEENRWRAEELAQDIIRRHLASFALSFNEYSKINGDNAPEYLSKAAKMVYETEKYSRRGEFGELILHSLLRDFINSIPVVSKIYFKDGPNETVKGFDSVHFKRDINDRIEILLGEAKFYNNANNAIRDVTKEISDHLEKKYLRSEFLAITNKISDGDDRDFNEVKELLAENTSLDKIFSRITIPIFITYNSQTIGIHNSTSEQFNENFIQEVRTHRDSLQEKLEELDIISKVNYIFLILPLLSKEDLVESFNRKLNLYKEL